MSRYFFLMWSLGFEFGKDFVEEWSSIPQRTNRPVSFACTREHMLRAPLSHRYEDGLQGLAILR